MEFEQEIFKLRNKIVVQNCIGYFCDYPSQKDHSCLSNYHQNLALLQALDTIHEQNKNTLDIPLIYERLKLEEF
ncbi:unnamed protein product [Brachionus calyciflorus]|uniref:Uncharacterized protein n=1 Tax=Brachionus calyciflorus TaxID=104777 RepID=A0A813SUN0_9BILA|nr:unnamed protein product [Brachionus calyciflorus]